MSSSCFLSPSAPPAMVWNLQTRTRVYLMHLPKSDLWKPFWWFWTSDIDARPWKVAFKVVSSILQAKGSLPAPATGVGDSCSRFRGKMFRTFWGKQKALIVKKAHFDWSFCIWLSKLASVDWQSSIVHIHFPGVSTDGDHHIHLDFPSFFGFPGLILFLWQRLEFWILDLQTALKKYWKSLLKIQQFCCHSFYSCSTRLRLSSCQSWKLLEDHSAQAVLDPKRGNLALLHTCGRNCELGWNTQLDLQLNWWQEQGNDIHWAIWKHVHHQAAGLVLDAEWQRLCPWLPRHRNSCDSGFKPKQAVQVLRQASVFRSHEECQDHCESRNCSHHVPVLPSP